MAEHTKEPWATTPGDVHRYVAGGGQFIRDTQGVIIAEVFPCGSDPQRMAADAARIVACVNGYAELEEAAREVLRADLIADEDVVEEAMYRLGRALGILTG